MRYLSYQRVASDGTAKGASQFDVPAGCTHVELQADTQDIRYRMDGVGAPSSTQGMLFRTTDPPKSFTINDFNRISFTQGAGGAGGLNAHFIGNS